MFLRRLLLLCLLASHLLAMPGLARAATHDCLHAPVANPASASTPDRMDHAAMGHGDHPSAAAVASQPTEPSAAAPNSCHCGCACAGNHCMPGSGLALPLALGLWPAWTPADRLLTAAAPTEPRPAHQATRLRPPDRQTA